MGNEKQPVLTFREWVKAGTPGIIIGAIIGLILCLVIFGSMSGGFYWTMFTIGLLVGVWSD